MVSAGSSGFTTYATPNDRDIVITRIVDAPRHIVFEAWTNPSHLPNWLTGPDGWTMPVCEIDLRPGGAWKYVYRKSDGAEMTLSGAYREIDPPARIVFTERWGPDWPETVNTLVLAETSGRTTITLTVTYVSKEIRDTALLTGMKEGIDMGFTRLDSLLASLT